MTNEELIQEVVDCAMGYGKEGYRDVDLCLVKARLKSRLDELDRIKAALPKTKDGVAIVPGLLVWCYIDGDDYYHGVEGRSGWHHLKVEHQSYDNMIVVSYHNSKCIELWDQLPSDLFHRHPVTGLTVE